MAEANGGPARVRVLLTAAALMAALVIGAGVLGETFRPERELGWQWVTRLIGGPLCAVGAFELVVAAKGGGPGSRQLPWLVVVLAGVLIVNPSWGAGLGLGAVGVVLALQGWSARGPRRAGQATSRRLGPRAGLT